MPAGSSLLEHNAAQVWAMEVAQSDNCGRTKGEVRDLYLLAALVAKRAPPVSRRDRRTRTEARASLACLSPIYIL